MAPEISAAQSNVCMLRRAQKFLWTILRPNRMFAMQERAQKFLWIILYLKLISEGPGNF